MSDWMIYGVSGYTGELIAREAAARGLRPILAGRGLAAVKKLGDELNLPIRVFPLDAGDAIAKNLAGIRLVLSCAGPFSVTAPPMIDACLQSRTHYLDITGEIEVIEHAASRGDEAQRVGVALLPAVGFDVAPSDCLAKLLSERLPDATQLQLAFSALGAISPGTAKTVLRTAPSGGRARLNGKIQNVPIAWKTRKIPFADRARWAVTIPWGDVASAFYSTGIGNIEVYTSMSKSQIRWLKRLRGVLPALRFAPLASLAAWSITRWVRGPSATQLIQEQAQLWGRVEDAGGQAVEATLTTPSAYRLTVLTALAAVERMLTGNVSSGFQTPAKAFGSEFILNIPDVQFAVAAN